MLQIVNWALVGYHEFICSAECHILEAKLHNAGFYCAFGHGIFSDSK
jgi:hypothetical protein